MIITNSSKWNKDNKSVKATQIAFELEQDIAKKVQKLAAENSLTASSQIRKIIGLSFSPPKRPRLTISLSPEDYKILGKKYNLSPDEHLEIKRNIIKELVKNFS